MSILWERLAGDTSKFALKLAFHKDVDCEWSSGATENSCSWGSFQIWVGGQNLCIHTEPGAESLDSVNWYLLPLIEWFVDNWNPLFHEERFPITNSGYDSWFALRGSSFPRMGEYAVGSKQAGPSWQEWWGRHNIQAAREGGLFPDVYFRRWRDRIEISWGPTVLPGMPDGFRFRLQNDHLRLDASDVVNPLYDVVRDASSYLRSNFPSSDRIKKLWSNVNNLQKGNYGERLPWLTGIGATTEDFSRLWKKLRDRFPKKGEQVDAVFGSAKKGLFLGGSCHAALMFGSVSPSISFADATILARQLIDLYSPKGDPERVSRLVTEEAIASGEDAWASGYRLAQSLLEKLPARKSETTRVDVESIINSLGIRVDPEFALEDTSIRAISIAGPHHSPAILINRNYGPNQSRWGHRFTLAHEFCHILFDRSYGKQLAIATGPWAPKDIEKRANAFAAMFLMPPDLIMKLISRLSVPLDSLEGVLEVAHGMDTSFTSTLEHLVNLGFIDEGAHDRILQERDSPIN